MLSYVARRVAQGVAVALVVTMVVFVVTRVVGDPARRMLPIDVTPEEYALFAERLGFDRPLPVQFADFVGDLVRLDFGDSIWRQAPAAGIVLARMPNTLRLLGAGLVLALLLGLVLGTLSALWPRGWLDRVLSATTLSWLSLPVFWIGAVLMLVFAVHLRWLPTSGAGSSVHLVLPAVTMGLPIGGRIAQVVREAMAEQLRSQHVVAARARGLSELTVVRHALRNVVLPVTSFTGWETIRAFAGATVVVETVFGYPGVGYLVMQAIRRDDVILVQAAVLIVALVVVATYILFDVLYTWLDPRIRLTR